jgi:hypothetical protein
VVATVAQHGPGPEPLARLICACEAAAKPKLAQELLALLQLQQVEQRAEPAAALIRLLTQQPSRGPRPALAASAELEVVQVRRQGGGVLPWGWPLRWPSPARACARGSQLLAA